MFIFEIKTSETRRDSQHYYTFHLQSTVGNVRTEGKATDFESGCEWNKVMMNVKVCSEEIQKQIIYMFAYLSTLEELE